MQAEPKKTNVFAKKNCHEVLLGQSWYSRTYLFESDLMAGQQLLSTIHARMAQHANPDNVRPRCGCLGRSPGIAMTIARHGDAYHLKRLPKTGKAHHPECESYGASNHNYEDTYTSNAVKILPNGDTTIKLDIVLQSNGPSATAKNTTRPPTQTNKKQASVSLLGLLHILWEDAGINAWHKGLAATRNYRNVFARLAEAMTDKQLGNSGPMDRYVSPISPCANQLSTQKAILLDIFQKHPTQWIKHDPQSPLAGQRPVAIVVGELSRIIKTKDQPKIPGRIIGLVLKGLTDIVLWENRNLISDSHGRFRNEFRNFYHRQDGQSSDAQKGTITIVVAAIAPKHDAKGQLCAELIHLSLMDVTGHYIPYASSYERDMANHLVAQQRAFSKPLRYDGQQETFPDFVLEDTDVPAIIEVYGMDNPAYNARKAEKHAIYLERGVLQINWDAYRDRQFPSLPSKARYHG